MDYSKLAELIPEDKRIIVSDQLVGYLLTSKNDEKMPNDLANIILQNLKNRASSSTAGLTALLEAALLLEAEKTLGFLSELQLSKVVEQVKGNA